MEYKLELFTRPDEIRLRKKIMEDIENTDLDNILDIEVGVWPKRVKVSDKRSWSIIENYQRYRGWAEKNGLSLYPGFKRELIENNYINKHYEEIIFPIVSIAIYKNDDIVFVFPSTKTDTGKESYYKVGDFINLLKNKKINKKLKDTPIETLIKQEIEKNEIKHKK